MNSVVIIWLFQFGRAGTVRNESRCIQGLSNMEIRLMEMKLPVFLFAALPLAVTTSVLAQQPTAPQQKTQQTPAQTTQQSQQNPAQNAQQIQAKVRQNLEQAGFTDIHMMPSSFLVRAKDKDGNPVMMVINPDSIEAVTFERGNAGTTAGQGNINQQQGGSGQRNR
jgi:outer membrane receptor protein involved in Fe transport